MGITYPIATVPSAHRRRFDPRMHLAVRAATAAAWMSRTARRGAGSIIGGRLALLLDPAVLSKLTESRTVALVSGTNGKTTTSHLLSAALGTSSAVASNAEGANMPDGLVSAILRQRRAPLAVLEVDEPHVPQVAEAVRPAAVVLLNLSRDQLDRVGEVHLLEGRLRRALSHAEGTTVVANADDVLVVSAARACPDVVWVAAGSPWRLDARACPRCAGVVTWVGDVWSCSCGLARPEPQWALDEGAIRTPDGRHLPLRLQLPGRANRANAVMALAAAVTLGVPVGSALEAVSAVRSVNGRYRVRVAGGHECRLLLAKNPAGWLETLSLLGESNRPVLIVVNGREADGRDLSWLWDVPFEDLSGRTVLAAGERAADLAARLSYAGVPCTWGADPQFVLRQAPPGPLDVVANYTAFLELEKGVGADGR